MDDLDALYDSLAPATGAGDDLDTLFDQLTSSRRKTTWGEIAEAAPSVAQGGGAQGVGGVLETVGELAGTIGREAIEKGRKLNYPFSDAERQTLAETGQPLSRAGAGIAESGRRQVDEALPEGETGFWQRATLTASQSSVPLALALLTRGLTRDPKLAAKVATTGIGAFTGGQEFSRARSEGMENEDAAKFGAAQGLIEGATEAIPFAKLFPGMDAPLRSIGKKAAEFMAAEIPGEMLATAGQGLMEVLVGLRDDPDGKLKPLAEWAVKDLPKEELDTIGATLVMGGPTVAVAHGLDVADRRARAQDAAAARDILSAPTIDAAIQAAERHATPGDTLTMMGTPIERVTDASLQVAARAGSDRIKGVAAAELARRYGVQAEGTAATSTPDPAASPPPPDLRVINPETGRTELANRQDEEIRQLARRDVALEDDFTRAEDDRIARMAGEESRKQREIDAAYKAEQTRQADEAVRLSQQGTAAPPAQGRQTAMALAMQRAREKKAALDARAHEAATSPENALPQPTEGQQDAGNYRKGHVRVHGLDISIENPKGSTRSGTDPDGKPWEVQMSAHYGYIRRTEGKDGDQVDVYLAEGAEQPDARAFVVDQVDLGTGKFDEHKVILGAADQSAAEALYDAHFSDGKGAQRRGAITAMTVDQFKDWLTHQDTTRPVGTLRAAAPQPAPPRPMTPARERYRKESRVNSKTDDLLVAIAKLGGISREDAKASGIDPAEFRRLGWKIKRVFTSGGDSMDGMAERLSQWGYPVTNERGLRGQHPAGQAGRGPAGNRVHSKDGAEDAAAAMAAARDDAADQQTDIAALDEAAGVAIERPTDDRGEPDWLLDDDQYDGLETTEDQHLGDVTEWAMAQGLSEDEIETILERGALQGQTNDEIKQQITERIRAAGAGVEAGAQGQRQTAEAAPVLESYTEEDLTRRASEQEASQQREVEADKKNAADRERDTFTLTGSNREADEAAARGQQDLLSQPTPQPADALTAATEKLANAAEKLATAADRIAPTQQADLLSGQTAAPITDAGENLWYNRRNFTGKAITWDSIKGLNETLRVKEVQKAKVWPRPDYEQLVADGMHPLIARLIKQAYDGIAATPSDVTDEGLQTYIEAVTHVRDTVFEWARDADANREFLQQVTDMAQRMTSASGYSARVSLMSLVGKNDWTRALLNRVWPDGIRSDASRTQARAVGRKAVRGLQFDVSDLLKATKEINAGWPASQEAWQKQGFRVLDKSAARVREGWRGEKGETPAHRIMLGEYFRATYFPETYATSAEAEAALAALPSHFLIDPAGRVLSQHASEEEAKEAARAATRRVAKGRDLRGMNVAQAEREGPARRAEGENITSERLMQEFGFRGVNFGRDGWINQAERQAYLNHAFDGLYDLAEIMGVPPKALSLNGMLGIAFGAQGRGGSAAAHFVPGHNEINLTKTMGAGTLAHEWGHALDHYFAVMAGLSKESNPFLSDHVGRPDAEGYVTRRSGFGYDRVKAFSDTLRPEIAAAFRAIHEAMNKRQRTADEVAAVQQQADHKSEKALESWIAHFRKDLERNVSEENRERALALFDVSADQLRAGELGERARVGQMVLQAPVAAIRLLFKEYAKNNSVDIPSNWRGLEANARQLAYRRANRDATATHVPQITRTTYASESAAKDKDKGGKAYWNTEWEKFARAFETWVASRIADQARKNTFLSDAHQRAESKDREGGFQQPYPRGEEREAMNAAFDTLVKTIETRETESGVGMFSRPAVQPQTETPEFRRWFGDSKMVDEQGRPMVFYHGTNKNFAVFGEKRNPDKWNKSVTEIKSGREDVGRAEGFYFSTNPVLSSMFAGQPKESDSTGPNIMPVYLSIRRPLVVDGQDFTPTGIRGLVYEAVLKMSPKTREVENLVKAFRANPMSSSSLSRDDITMLERHGYDGIVNYILNEIVAFRPEQIKSATGNRGTFDPNDPSITYSRPTWTIDPQDDPATVVAKLLAQDDDFFVYRTTDARDMESIVSTVAKDVLVKQEDITPDPRTPAKDRKIRQWTFTMPDGNQAKAEEYANGEIYINASLLESEKSKGSALYAAVADYAYNNGLVFIGDPAGISEAAHVRRIEHMLASAMKHGTTRHLAPHEDQEQIGVRPIQWIPGDDANNFQELVRTSLANTEHLVPEIRELAYNFDSGQFIDEQGNEQSAKRLRAIANEANERNLAAAIEGARARGSSATDAQLAARSPKVGGRTIARAVLLRSVASEAGQDGGAGWSGLLAKLGRLLQSGPPATLRGLSYSRTNTDPASGGVSVSEAGHYLRRRGMGPVLDSGQLEIVQHAGEIPHAAFRAGRNDDIWGWHDGGDKSYIVAGNVSLDPGAENNAFGVALHELGVHHGLRGMVGDKVFDDVLAQVRGAAERGRAGGRDKLARAAAAARGMVPAETPEHLVDEETVAYLVQSPENHNLTPVRRIIAAIRMWFLRTFKRPIKLTPDDIVMLARGAVQHVTSQATPHGPELAAEQAYARRISRGSRQTPNDFVIPETPEYEHDTSGDLAVLPEDVTGGLEPLPIRLRVGKVTGPHRGYGVMHWKDVADGNPRREPPAMTGEREENFARRAVAVARTVTEAYQEETGGDRYILRSRSLRDALVVERAEDADGIPFYSIISVVPAEGAVLQRWGSPVWSGRAEVPDVSLRQTGAPDLPSGRESPQPERQTLGVQTDKFKFTTTSAKIQFRRRRGTPEGQFSRPKWVDQQPPETQEALRKAGVWRQEESLADRLRAWAETAKREARQGLFDQFDQIKAYDYHSYMLARLTRGADAALEAALQYGTVSLDADGAVALDFEGGGFFKLLSGLQGEHERWMAWVVGNRAQRLLAEGKEHNFTPEDITRLQALAGGTMPDGTPRAETYRRAAEELARHNRKIMDIAERTGLIDAETRPIWEKDMYIPFYRLMEDEGVTGPVKSGGLVRQYAFKTLKGGAQAIGDPLRNILSNWSHLLDASLKNQAAVSTFRAAEKVGAVLPAKAGDKGAVFVLENGEKRYYTVADPFLLDAVTALGFTGFQGRGMKVLQKFKRWLTFGVTISPTFRIRNVIRDSLAMIAANPASYNVLSNLSSGWRSTREGSPEYASIIAGGGVMRFGTVLEGDRAEHAKRLIEAGIDDATVLDNPSKIRDALQQAWDWWQHVGDRAENVNRVALYKKLRDEGRSHLEASFAARDVMDFSMQGQWAAIRFLTQTVPFLNARLQGLYKLGRGAKEDPRRFSTVLAATSMFSMLLLLAYQDDDDWQRREDWDRETYWWFKVGDKAFRIPKPFEVGAIATMAERGLELLTSEEFGGKEFAMSLWHILLNQLSFNPIPQAVMPPIELWANQDMFTGRPIESAGMEHLSKSERIGPETSALAQTLGKTGALSPVQIDHLITGYFAWLGATVLATSDLALRPLTDAPTKPEPRIDDLFVVGDFVKELPSYQSKYVSAFYEDARATQERLADVRHYAKLGLTEKALALRDAHRDDVMLGRLYASAQRQMATINGAIRRVQAGEGTATEKRQRLDALYTMRNRLAEIIQKRARATRAATQ